MSTDSEWQDSCDDEPDIDSYQCYVSITRLTDKEIERWTNPALVNSTSNNSLTTIDHNYSVSSVTYDSDASTVEDSDVNRPEGSIKKTVTDGPSSLYDDDEIISIELDKSTKKKVQIYDKCTIPEKLVSRYNALKKRYSSTIPLFCLFCLKEFSQVNQVLSCHYQQAKHFPFRCVECEESTLDIKGMMQHYTKTHPTLTHVQYRRSFAPAKERWVQKFVIYQLKCITNQAIMIPNGILHKYCPVCNQWDYKLGDKYPKNKPQHKLITVLDKNHIHKHLKYHPFQCLLCLKKNVRCDFTVVNKKARLHLINRHGFSNPTEQDLKDNFDSLGMIPELERYINSYVKFVQESFTRQTFRLSPIADTSSQTPKKILSTPPSSASKQSTPLSILSGGKKSGSSGKASKAISKLTTGKKRRHEYTIDDMYYPSPKYARRDYSKPKNGKKPYSTDSSVIDLDSFYEDSRSIYLKPDQAPRIICIFCNYQVTDILAAWDHYATHLDYRPINCQLCHKSFPGPKAFQLHGSDHVDHDNLPYTWHHDEIIEAWSRDFLNSIINDINANPEFACFCPICSKKFQKQKVSSQKPSYEDVRKHIFIHLRYQPYHCNLCTGDKVFVADLDIEGVRHLSFHEIVCSKEELPNHFTRSRGIEAVDSFLIDHFKKIRQLFNTTSGNISADGNVTNDPLCDVELLFNSLQETLGHNTLNNILDNVSHSEDRSSNQIDYPCTPSSTTSDPVTASSPIEPYEESSPPSPVKPIATVTNESSDTMIPSASESSTSAKSSPNPAESSPAPIESSPAPIESSPAPAESSSAVEKSPIPAESPPTTAEISLDQAESSPTAAERSPAPTESSLTAVEKSPILAESSVNAESSPDPAESSLTPAESSPASAEITSAESTPAPVESAPASAEISPALTESSAPTESSGPTGSSSPAESSDASAKSSAPVEISPAVTESSTTAESTPTPVESSLTPAESSPASAEITPAESAPAESTPALTESSFPTESSDASAISSASAEISPVATEISPTTAESTPVPTECSPSLAQNSPTTAESSSTQESPMDVTIIKDENNEKIVVISEIKKEKLDDEKKISVKTEDSQMVVDIQGDVIKPIVKNENDQKVSIKQERIHPEREKQNLKNSNASKRDSTGSVKPGPRKMPVRKGRAIVVNKSTNTSPKPPEIKEIKLRSKTIVSTGTPSSRTRSKTTKVTTATQTRS